MVPMDGEGTAAPAVRLRTIAASIFLPALVYEIGNGAIGPVAALTAIDLGASPKQAGFLLALIGIGQVAGDVPSPWLTGRVGDRRAMVIACVLAVTAVLACAFTRSLVLFGVALTVLGACNAVFYLARMSYVTDVVPLAIRARALSTLAGAHRVGLFIGPFAGAAAIAVGGMRAPYLVAVGSAITAAGLLLIVPDVSSANQHAAAGGRVARNATVRVLRAHIGLLATLGLAVCAVGAVRAARQTVLPLWAEHIGLTAVQTSLIFGLANAADMALFYPSGKIMDHFGRLWIAVPSMALLGGAMTLLPLAHGAVLFTVIALLMSMGNGFGSGIVMTLGADSAPVPDRLTFLSLWRVMGDAGSASGPLVMSLVATAFALQSGIVAVGCIGLLAALGLGVFAPRYSPFATPAMVRAYRTGRTEQVRTVMEAAGDRGVRAVPEIASNSERSYVLPA